MVGAPERIWAFQSDGGRRGWLHTRPPQAIIDIPTAYVRADLFDALTEERDRLKQWQADQVEVIDEAKALITELNADKKALEAERDRLERDRDFWKEQFQVETRYRIELADKGTLQALTDANSRMEKAEAERDRLAKQVDELQELFRIDGENHASVIRDLTNRHETRITKYAERIKELRDANAELLAERDRLKEIVDGTGLATAAIAAERDRLAKANAELLAEIESARMTLAAWDQGSLPNDMTLREICEARIDDLSKYMARAESMDALPFDRRDIERGLILFRTSNNAHGTINFVSLTWKVDSLPQSSKDEMASIMRNIAHSLETSALLTKHKATSTEPEGE